MDKLLKEIAQGQSFKLTFKKTTVYKQMSPVEEIKITEYLHETNDEYFSEIIFQVPIGRGLATWFNFNKVENLEKLGVIDYHKNILMGQYTYNTHEDIEYVSATAVDNQPIFLTIQKNKHGYMADILISFNNFAYRIHLEKLFSK